jgi:DNA-nicking Smr family endonuclease
MRPRDSRRRLLTPDERVLWTTFTRAIAPLRAGASPHIETETDAAPETADAAVLAQPARPIPTRPGAPPPVTETPAPPALAPLGRRLRQRVARGKESIDGRLDLHGLTQSEAHAALLRFLRNASARAARLVLVITGKGAKDAGARGDGERGVLKRQVPHWLGQPEFRAFVIGFEQAHVAHGGEGALYVRIRRTRG